MADCEIHEDIGKGQCEKRVYRIWSIFKRESPLLYWYLVLYDDTYYGRSLKNWGRSIWNIR